MNIFSNNLTWRDIQHLIVYSSVVTSPLDVDWTKNGANLSVSHKFGFGKLDAYNLVSLGKLWVNVPPQLVYQPPIITSFLYFCNLFFNHEN